MKKTNLIISGILLATSLLSPTLINAKEIVEYGYLRGQEYSEWETIYIEKTIAKEGQKQKILDKIEAERQAKLEAERQAKLEAEAKAKAEAEKKAQQSQDGSPISVAQWENNNYADVHERANDGCGKAKSSWSDAQYYQYLQALRDDLLSSGEMQWMWCYEQGLL